MERLSIRTFAAREGLEAGSLSVWKWNLAHGRDQRPAAAPAAPLKFVELTAAAGGGRGPLPPPAHAQDVADMRESLRAELVAAGADAAWPTWRQQ